MVFRTSGWSSTTRIVAGIGMSRGKPVTGCFALRSYAPDIFVCSIQERP
jgi:hypothetical protein